MQQDTASIMTHRYFQNLSWLLPSIATLEEKWHFLSGQLGNLYHILNTNTPDIELTTHHPDSPSLIVKWPWDKAAYEVQKITWWRVHSHYINTNSSDRGWILPTWQIALKSDKVWWNYKKKMLLRIVDCLQSEDTNKKQEIAKLLTTQFFGIKKSIYEVRSNQFLPLQWSNYHTLLQELCQLFIPLQFSSDYRSFLEFTGQHKDPNKLSMKLISLSILPQLLRINKDIHSVFSQEYNYFNDLTQSEKEQLILSLIQNTLRTHIIHHHPEIKAISESIGMTDGNRFTQKLWSLDTDRIQKTQECIKAIAYDDNFGIWFMEWYLRFLMQEKSSQKIQVASIALQWHTQQLFVCTWDTNELILQTQWWTILWSGSECIRLLSGEIHIPWMRLLQFNSSLIYLWPALTWTISIGSERWIRESLCAFLTEYQRNHRNDYSQLIQFIQQTKFNGDNTTNNNEWNNNYIPIYTDNFKQKKFLYYAALAHVLKDIPSFTTAYFDQLQTFDLQGESTTILTKLMNLPENIESIIQTKKEKRGKRVIDHFSAKIQSDPDNSVQREWEKNKALDKEQKLFTLIEQAYNNYHQWSYNQEDLLVLAYILNY